MLLWKFKQVVVDFEKNGDSFLFRVFYIRSPLETLDPLKDEHVGPIQMFEGRGLFCLGGKDAEFDPSHGLKAGKGLEDSDFATGIFRLR